MSLSGSVIAALELAHSRMTEICEITDTIKPQVSGQPLHISPRARGKLMMRTTVGRRHQVNGLPTKRQKPGTDCHEAGRFLRVCDQRCRMLLQNPRSLPRDRGLDSAVSRGDSVSDA